MEQIDTSESKGSSSSNNNEDISDAVQVSTCIFISASVSNNSEQIGHLSKRDNLGFDWVTFSNNSLAAEGGINLSGTPGREKKKF